MTRSLVACLLVIAFAGTPTSRARAEGDMALVGGTVHVGDGQVLPGATVLIANGKITGVGALAVPAGSKLVDVTGLHVSPGFIAADTVLGLTEISAVRATRDESEVGRLNAHVRAWAAVNPDSELLPVAMANGVLHAVVAPRAGLVSGTSAVMVLRGWTREDMVLRGPAALHVSWPALQLDRSKGAKVPLADQERQRAEALEELASFFADSRVYVAARPAREDGLVPRADRDVRLEALEPVLSGEIPVVVTADTVPQVRAALAFAREHGVRLVLAGCQDCSRIAGEIAAAGVPVIVEPVRALPARDFEPYDVRFTNAVTLRNAGVKVCFSVGREAFSAAHVRNLPDEAAMTIAFGMPPEEALRAITLSPAEVFGVADQIGSVAAGKLANLVTWDGPPLEITSRGRHVILRGVEIDVDDRHSRLNAKYSARPKPAGR